MRKKVLLSPKRTRKIYKKIKKKYFKKHKVDEDWYKNQAEKMGVYYIESNGDLKDWLKGTENIKEDKDERSNT